jgi:UDP-N-acetylmuramoyl-L-alanyl-D-glutamate--2,6-diaminopimelate ligase
MTWTELRALLIDRGLLREAGTSDLKDIGAGPTGVSYDSRCVKPGELFVALKGQHADGTSFARDAIGRGATAVISEQPAPSGIPVPWLTVEHARLALALASAKFYDDPSTEMQVVGITGTNGKTTTAFLIGSIFDAAGIRCGVLGTVGYRIGDKVREATHTTPEAPEVQRLLREMVDERCKACAMEVSSHALSQQRVEGTRFAAAVFTNLTRDHLDFHSSMESYFQAKRRLFEMLPVGAPALINADDPRGAAFAEAGGRTVTYAVSRPADITPGPLSFSLDGLTFDVRTPRGTIHVQSSLVGRPNVYNILAAVSTATALGLSFDAIERGLAALKGVPGRFQVVSDPKDDFTVVVDYAHTDDALRNLLETARPLARGRLITVFGCGGDRDRTKRPLMGAVAGRLSDVIVLTSDNPRSEDPNRILAEVQRGLSGETRRDTGPSVLSITDRRAAIRRAIELARAGDIVLVAGKGHEKYQVVGDQVIPFDDAAVAREALGRRRSSSGVL